MTSHPVYMDDELIECHKKNIKLMPFVHLPIQSGSDEILKNMNRKYKVKDYIKIIEKLRLSRKDIAVSSDFIVGFPGETDEDFENTIKLINEVNFSIAYSFCFSSRPGTPSSKLTNHIEEKIKKERLEILQNLLKKQQEKYNNSFVGKNLSILFEKKGRHSKQYIGRSIYNQSVFMNSNENLIGKIINTKINRNTNFALSAVNI